MENREIKFRAWDAHQQKMIYFNNDTMWDTNWLNTSFIMQYVGLKDKNGVEIYEGDIIECPFEKAEVLLANFPEGKFEFGVTRDVVVFKDGVFCVEADIPIKETVLISQFNTVCEIIGNTFDNPELINQP